MCLKDTKHLITSDTIRMLKDQGLTQAEIGEVMGVSKESIKQHSALIANVVTNILDLCKSVQVGRVTETVTNVSFNFTEGWFRNSGLYDLTQEGIADILGVTHPTIINICENVKKGHLSNFYNSFTPLLYNIWNTPNKPF